MLRVKDPEVEVPFWQTNFGFELVARLDFPQWKFSLYFMGTVPEGITLPEDRTSKEAIDLLWNWPGVLLELTHNHGTETAEENPYVSGNVEPHRGFGHVAVMTPDVYAACEVLEKNGVTFHKKPDEGRMKGLAFALSPSGYWIEVIRGNVAKYTLAQTMIRVKDPAKSVAFYRDHFGMQLVSEKHFPSAKFSLYFMATIPAGVTPPKDPKLDGSEWMKNWDGCVLELTHNHGTETDADFSYWNGNGPTKKGFGHIGFLVDDVYAHSEMLEKAGVPFHKKPDEGGMKGLAFALDPDMYWVEIIKRGMSMP